MPYRVTLALLVGLILAAPGAAWASGTKSTADHGKFEQLKGPFKSGPEVTAACLECHTEAASQLHKTTHWSWAFISPITGEELGKRNVVNNFCVATATNWPRCTSCHIGYGWDDDSFDLSQETAVDCLVCHDTTGTYKKYPAGAGHPAYVDKTFPPNNPNGEMFEAVDLGKVARSVGRTGRDTCGACHFTGGGGNGVKHGDMDTSLIDPPRALDVHMSPDGEGFTCATCHNPDGHDVPGSRYAPTARDTAGFDTPSAVYKSHATCESCHGTEAHAAHPKLNDHTDKVACQTCHIPEYARGGFKTKMWWDWSTAGTKVDGQKVVKDADGYPLHDVKKGDFRWQANVVPEYFWFDGRIDYTLLNETIDPQGVVEINSFSGGPHDPTARIWPFKVMRGRQPIDAEKNILAVPHLFGQDEDAFWGGGKFDWNKALRAGLRERGVDYSGSHAFVESAYYWPITHMVAPKEDAVGCNECHTTDGRLASLSGFYMPGRDSIDWLSKLGWASVALALAAVTGHALIRVFFALFHKVSQ
ncbi:tetrathionate reductase family octaheme c-type cytochrome [Roseospirillum parvum]|uniref:Octaheme c-type cytochrome, tetrathionate reductase family n=1 Tax=Roseospirillum parvum TaxID=83401 RepID=A0A1G8DJP8_9PROT|nr:tetrathionate reductase family octaheme c-type cytochrome [Roseospirillum parvum]SDH57801.1 octaheme c-type cytochrome, tetrathionate reductase family [Roseospirillum parvum]